MQYWQWWLKLFPGLAELTKNGYVGRRRFARTMQLSYGQVIPFFFNEDYQSRYNRRANSHFRHLTEEQFKVELFESITKLNKFREFSKSSYKEINSKCCWYCHKRVQEGLSYGENRVLGKVWNMQGICIPGCGGVMQVRELQVSTTESVSGIVTGFVSLRQG